MTRLPDKLLLDYAKRFYGYGSGRASMWFVGMEEGGGWSLEDVHGRLIAWAGSTTRRLQDLRSFHLARGETRWHGDSPKLQRTWSQLIRMFLMAHGKGDSPAEVLRFQKHEFGRQDGAVCAIELLPLPSPGLGTWHYPNWSRLPWLTSRDSYRNFLLSSRVRAIQKAISHYRPKVVIFYGSSWLRSWSMVAQVQWRQAIQDRLLGGGRDGIAFYVTQHPARQSDEYFREIGNFLRRTHGAKI